MTGPALGASAGQVPERHVRVVGQHVMAPTGLGLGLGTRQELGMCTVPLVGPDEERVPLGVARAVASQTVQARRIARMAPCYDQHARGPQEVACWDHTQLRLRHGTCRLDAAPPWAMRKAHLQAPYGSCVGLRDLEHTDHHRWRSRGLPQAELHVAHRMCDAARMSGR